MKDSQEIDETALGQSVALVNFKGFKFQSMVTPDEVFIESNLNDFQVEDLLQTFGPSYQYLFRSSKTSQPESNEEKDLVYVNYVSRTKESPNYQNIDRSIDFTLNSLDIISNRETMATLVYIFVKLIKGDDSSEMETKHQSSILIYLVM